MGPSASVEGALSAKGGAPANAASQTSGGKTVAKAPSSSFSSTGAANSNSSSKNDGAGDDDDTAPPLAGLCLLPAGCLSPVTESTHVRDFLELVVQPSLVAKGLRKLKEKEYFEEHIRPLVERDNLGLAAWTKFIDPGLCESRKLRMYLCDKFDTVYRQEFRPLLQFGVLSSSSSHGTSTSIKVSDTAAASPPPLSKPFSAFAQLLMEGPGGQNNGTRRTLPFASDAATVTATPPPSPATALTRIPKEAPLIPHSSMLRLTSLRSPSYAGCDGLMRDAWADAAFVPPLATTTSTTATVAVSRSPVASSGVAVAALGNAAGAETTTTVSSLPDDPHQQRLPLRSHPPVNPKLPSFADLFAAPPGGKAAATDWALFCNSTMAIAPTTPASPAVGADGSAQQQQPTSSSSSSANANRIVRHAALYPSWWAIRRTTTPSATPSPLLGKHSSSSVSLTAVFFIAGEPFVVARGGPDVSATMLEGMAVVAAHVAPHVRVDGELRVPPGVAEEFVPMFSEAQARGGGGGGSRRAGGESIGSSQQQQQQGSGRAASFLTGGVSANVSAYSGAGSSSSSAGNGMPMDSCLMPSSLGGISAFASPSTPLATTSMRLQTHTQKLLFLAYDGGGRLGGGGATVLPVPQLLAAVDRCLGDEPCVALFIASTAATLQMLAALLPPPRHLFHVRNCPRPHAFRVVVAVDDVGSDNWPKVLLSCTKDGKVLVPSRAIRDHLQRTLAATSM